MPNNRPNRRHAGQRRPPKPPFTSIIAVSSQAAPYTLATALSSSTTAPLTGESHFTESSNRRASAAPHHWTGRSLHRTPADRRRHAPQIIHQRHTTPSCHRIECTRRANTSTPHHGCHCVDKWPSSSAATSPGDAVRQPHKLRPTSASEDLMRCCRKSEKRQTSGPQAQIYRCSSHRAPPPSSSTSPRSRRSTCSSEREPARIQIRLASGDELGSPKPLQRAPSRPPNTRRRAAADQAQPSRLRAPSTLTPTAESIPPPLNVAREENAPPPPHRTGFARRPAPAAARGRIRGGRPAAAGSWSPPVSPS